jgi:L-methionine (R)-S-oxide reductase
LIRDAGFSLSTFLAASTKNRCEVSGNSTDSQIGPANRLLFHDLGAKLCKIVMDMITPLSPGTSKVDSYKQIYAQFSALIEGESDFLANAANLTAVLYHLLPDVNWVGFYLAQGEYLVLGPFQGKPATPRIPIGKGVCGRAASKQETVVVPDVEKVEDHIVCDPASRSEIVVPLLNWGKLSGVLDIDSPVLNRFDEEDREGLESLVSLFLSSLTSNDLPDFEALAKDAKA